jgi:hypothetical protein
VKRTIVVKFSHIKAAMHRRSVGVPAMIFRDSGIEA